MTRAPWEISAGALAAACVGWSIFLPIGVKYPLLLGATAWGLWQLQQPAGLQRIQAEPAARWALIFWVWSAMTLMWTEGTWPEALAQLGLYSLLLCVPVIGGILAAKWAQRALRHFCIGSGVVGSLCLLNNWALLPVPEHWIWRSTLTAEGNQRIVISLLIALGCAMSLREALLARTQGAGLWATLGWGAVACAAAAGLASQDRRTGMTTLPVLLLVLTMGWAVSEGASRVKRSAVAAAAVMCCVALGVGTPTVRERFAEGLGQLSRYNATENVANSWGMRLRMAEQSVQMVADSPLAGHGLGSWERLWTQRVPAGSLLAAQRTPHNEYLLVVVQTGLPGLILLLVALWTHATRDLRQNLFPVVPASLMVWSALAWAGLFNVVLRDAKFALPLLMLAALAWPGAGPRRGDDAGHSAASISSR